MRANNLRALWAKDQAVINGWLHIPTTYTAELMAHAGFDSLTVDMQHGPPDFNDLLPMLTAISTTDVVPLARVPWNEPSMMMRALDAGVYGVIAPMINSRAECEAFVGACRYPPMGYRSNGPFRASVYAGGDYALRANDTVVTFAMIETADAVKNLDAILSVKGLDAIYVGPTDLQFSLYGTPIMDGTDEKYLAVLQEIINGCKRHGIYAGIHTGGPTYSKRMIEMGFRFVTVGGDTGLMSVGARDVVKQMKGDQAKSKTPGY
jgi:4-hydroxy-2-oxoheptanedioate aldolase